LLTIRRLLVPLEVLLLLPAVAFLLATQARRLTALPLGVTEGAHRLVDWYAVRPWTLWVLLVAMPLAAFILGSVGATQARSRTLGTLTTLAGIVLVIVAVHVLAG